MDCSGLRDQWRRHRRGYRGTRSPGARYTVVRLDWQSVLHASGRVQPELGRRPDFSTVFRGPLAVVIHRRGPLVRSPSQTRPASRALACDRGLPGKTSAPQQVRQLSRRTTDEELNAVDLPGLTQPGTRPVGARCSTSSWREGMMLTHSLLGPADA
jgi:hypothetical protein